MIKQAETEIEAGGIFQIDGHSALATVEAEKIAGVLAGKRWSPATAHVTAARAFELEDLGAEIGEQHGAVRAGESVRKIENANFV